jgi:adenosine/AMP kinase
MAFVKTVDRYAAFLYPTTMDTKARINLYCRDGQKLYLLFVNEEDMSANTYSERNKVGVAYVTIDLYSDYIDLVRNEKPIYVTFKPESNPPVYVVYAAGEEPGEGEM